MRTCVVCVCRRVPTLQTRMGARRCSGADFCMFAAAMCVQVVTGAFGPAQKLPPPYQPSRQDAKHRHSCRCHQPQCSHLSVREGRSGGALIDVAS